MNINKNFKLNDKLIDFVVYWKNKKILKSKKDLWKFIITNWKKNKKENISKNIDKIVYNI